MCTVIRAVTWDGLCTQVTGGRGDSMSSSPQSPSALPQETFPVGSRAGSLGALVPRPVALSAVPGLSVASGTMRRTSSLGAGRAPVSGGRACGASAAGRPPRGAPLCPYTTTGRTAAWWTQCARCLGRDPTPPLSAFGLQAGLLLLAHCRSAGAGGSGASALHCHTAGGSGQWSSCNTLPKGGGLFEFQTPPLQTPQSFRTRLSPI